MGPELTLVLVKFVAAPGITCKILHPFRDKLGTEGPSGSLEYGFVARRPRHSVSCPSIGCTAVLRTEVSPYGPTDKVSAPLRRFHCIRLARHPQHLVDAGWQARWQAPSSPDARW